MSLNCVIGEAIYDKSKYVYNKTIELEEQGKSPIVFVPSQARMTSEEEYMLKTNRSGMLNTDITTLSRYISKVLDNSFSGKEYITDDVKRIYIKKIIDENRLENSMFSKVIDKPSFVDLVISYIDGIKKENIDVASIDKLDVSNNLTKLKLKEITEICNIVNEKISEKYVDSLDMLDIFNKYIVENKDEFKNVEIFFHGYNNFSKKELDVIKSFLSVGLNVTVSLTLPYDFIFLGSCLDNIFEIAYKTYVDLVNISKELSVKFNVLKDLDKQEIPEDVEYLIQNIFGNNYEDRINKGANISLVLEKNQNTEIENIAQDIVGKIRENDKLRFRDFAIYTNNFEEYEFCIKRIFKEYEIAYGFDDSSEVEYSNLTIYILTLLKIADEGLDINKLMLLLKTNLYSISNDDLNYLENYILEFDIKGYNFNFEFKKNNKEGTLGSLVYDLERLNSIREDIVKNINGFVLEIKEKLDIKGKIETIYNHALNSGVIKRYAEEIEVTEENSIKKSDLKKQVVSMLYEIFDNIAMLDENGNMKLGTFIELFEFASKDKTVKTIPMTIDQVEICDINKSRILPKKYIYMIGAYENGLPSLSNEDVMFSDKELDELKEKNIEIKQNSLTRTNMALFNVYMALSNVKEKLIITMSASKITGEPLRPGIIINEIKRILNIPLLGNIANEDNIVFDSHKMTSLVMFRNLLGKIVDIESVDEKQLEYLYSLYMYFIEKDDKYKEILEYSRKDTNLSEETLEALYNGNINSSVSRLETFKKCPFSYYANYILNIKPRKKYSMSILDMGTLMHDVLERFSKWTMERNILWPEIINDDKVANKAKEKVNEIVDRIFDEKYSKYKDSNRYIVLKSGLKRKMYKVISIIASSFNQSEFKPLGYEIEFKNGELYSPIEVNLENGKTMYLVGKIDRVDTAVINDKVYVRIVDYKSSNRTISLKDVKEGLSLQLMTYMSALINNKKNIDNNKEVLPAAINYFSLKTNIKRLDEYESDEDKISRELIKEMKLKGIYLSDVKVLEGLDRKYKDTGSSFIDINSRNINDENKVLDEDKFKKECNEIQDVLKQIGKEIVKGVVKIEPKKCNSRLACEYCDYLPVCRKDIRA